MSKKKLAMVKAQRKPPGEVETVAQLQVVLEFLGAAAFGINVEDPSPYRAALERLPPIYRRELMPLWDRFEALHVEARSIDQSISAITGEIDDEFEGYRWHQVVQCGLRSIDEITSGDDPDNRRRSEDEVH